MFFAGAAMAFVGGLGTGRVVLNQIEKEKGRSDAEAATEIVAEEVRFAWRLKVPWARN